MRKTTNKKRVKPQDTVMASAFRCYANDDNQVVVQLLDEHQALIAEMRFEREMSDVAIAYMMHAQACAWGMHPKSGWIQ